MTKRYQLLYTSRLLADITPACVSQIVAVARDRNRRNGIGSTLAFDGWRFCQYLEGAAADVCALAERIRTDRRHGDFRVLHHGACAGPTPLAGRSLMFALCYDASLVEIERVGGAQAVGLFADRAHDFDLEPVDDDGRMTSDV